MGFFLNSGSLKNITIFRSIIYFLFESESHLYTSVVCSLLPFRRQRITVFTSTINLTHFTILNQVMGLFSLSALTQDDLYLSLNGVISAIPSLSNYLASIYG